MMIGSIRFTIALLSMCALAGSLYSQVSQAPSSGDGSPGNPYQISSLENLYWIADDEHRWESSYVQTADINAAETRIWPGGSGWTPIGYDATTYFKGTYNGKGHRIDSLFINRGSASYTGLFGYTNNAHLDSIGLTNLDITGQSSVGGLVGLNFNSTISNSYSTGSVSGISYGVGGLVGVNYNSTISNSYSTGSISGSDFTGGLVGKTYSSTISNSYSTGSVSGTSSNYVGGLVGYNDNKSTISNCYSSGSVSGYQSVGGLVGENSDSCKISNCYSSGLVSGSADVGGLVGYSSVTGKVDNSFWDTLTSGREKSKGGTGKTTTQMRTMSTYTSAGWDYNGIWGINSKCNNGYPFLKWQGYITCVAPSSGDGSTGNPYQISSLTNLYWIADSASRWGYSYVQTADINAGETNHWYNDSGWTPIGNISTNFTGAYNGKGHRIDSLFINRGSTDYIGLFGIINNAHLDSIGLTNLNITGQSNVGGLVSENNDSSTISNSYSSGSVSGYNNVGGLVGDNYKSTISNSYSTGSVSGSDNVGGLVGDNGYNSTISNSYSTGSISGSKSSFGGLVGSGTGNVDNSFWDTQTSGQNKSAGGTGKTTTEMRTISTYTSAGWDFNGIWGINSTNNNGYPFLKWQGYMSCAAPSAGNGSPGNPYQISSLENLYWIADSASRWGHSYIQMVDINAAETRKLSGGSGWTPIGNTSTNFTGTYNGKGHRIDSLFINRSSTDRVGLFGIIINAHLDSIGLINLNITGQSYVGGLVGVNNYNSTISNSYSTGSVRGLSFIVGGLVGSNFNSTISSSYSSGSVNGTTSVGGLVGDNYNSTISNSYNSGSVNGTSNVGGLVGFNSFSGRINNSYSSGSISCTSNYAGGLVGSNSSSSTINNSYSSGSVNGSGSVGGLAGDNYNSKISNSYSTGSVNGTSNVGGLVGYSSGTDTVDNSFWDTQTSGKSTSAGGTGKTTAEMNTMSTYTSAGWDFNGIWGINSRDNGKYPFLKWQRYKLEQTISFTVPDSITYKDTSFTINASATSGLQVGFTSSDTSVATIKRDTVIIRGVGSTSISVIQNGNETYYPDTSIKVMKVGKQTLTIIGISANDKVYDGTTNVSLSVGTLSGVIPGDNVALIFGTGSFSNKNVGEGKAVTASGFKIGGADSANYTLSLPSGLTANITSAQLSITGVTANNKVYDGTTNASLSSGTLNGVIPGDNVTLISGTGSFSNKNVGEGKAVTVSGFILGGADSANYTLNLPSGLTANISPVLISINGVTTRNKVYDGTTNASLSGGTLNGVVTGDNVNLISVTGVFTDKNIGTDKAVIIIGFKLSGADSANYSLYQPSDLTATITAAPLFITGVTANNKIYDGTTNASLSGGTLIGDVAGDNVYLISGTGVFSDKNVGTGKAVTTSGFILGGVYSANYTLSQPSGLTANITSAQLSITGVTANNKVYDGTTNASLSGGTLNGAVTGDNVSLISGTGSFSNKNVGTGKAVTVSGFKIGGADSANYTLSQPSGLTANISASALTITGVTVANKVYDGTTSAILSGVPTISGVIPGDDIKLISGEIEFSDKNVGANKLIKIIRLIGGADVSNYTYDLPENLAADITPVPLTIKANNAVKNQYATDPVFTVTYSGFVPGDDSSVVNGLVIKRESGESPGAYIIMLSGAHTTNYEIDYVNSKLIINGATSVLKNNSGIDSKVNHSIKGIYIRSNPVLLSSGKADFRIVADVPSDMSVNIYDAVGNVVFARNELSYTGTVDMSWNLYTQNGHRARNGTYLIIAKIQSRADGSAEILKAKLGLKKLE